MIACGILIVANVDNLCRIILMKKISNTHPLIVIFGGDPRFRFSASGDYFRAAADLRLPAVDSIYYKEYRLLPPSES